MTNQELAEKLRCISTVHTDDPGCENCPFFVKEPVPEGMREIVEEDFYCFCDSDRVCHAAADALANSETHIMALQKAIEDLRARLPRWIPVEERLPEDCADVLALVTGLYGKCSFERAPMLCAWFGKDGWFCTEYPEWDNPGVTHWMPLPSTEGVE